MRIATIFFVSLMFLSLFYSYSYATENNSVDPSIKWTKRTHLVLAQCMLAEADESESDHIAIAYAALNWLKLVRKRYPRMRYVDLLLQYCSVHKLSVNKLSRRQRWIRQMFFPKINEHGEGYFDKPDSFPKKSSWKRKKRKWAGILRRANEWYLGKYKDPCRGKAIMWGAPQDKNNCWYLPSDKPSGNLVRVNCEGDLENWFYRLGTKKEKGSYGRKAVSKGGNAI